MATYALNDGAPAGKITVTCVANDMGTKKLDTFNAKFPLYVWDYPQTKPKPNTTKKPEPTGNPKPSANPKPAKTTAAPTKTTKAKGAGASIVATAGLTNGIVVAMLWMLH